jgi:aromatic ring-cleaving dioxygenase
MKSLKNWIKENRQELDKYIQSVSPGSPKNDHERRLWLLNDEGLYNWARSEGVRV